jgi:hypothetical protein
LKSGFAVPRAFISYAWEDRQHKQWIREIAVKLRLDGVELLLDQWELHDVNSLPYCGRENGLMQHRHGCWDRFILIFEMKVKP